jgi:ribonuclease HI
MHAPFDPPTQNFATEVLLLCNRYRVDTPLKEPKKTPKLTKALAHRTLPQQLLQHLTNSYSLTHSYYSNPLTCPYNMHQFYSPHARDRVFGSLGDSTKIQWNGHGFAHPPDQKNALTAIHQARMAARTHPNTLTIVVLPHTTWHSKNNPLQGTHRDTQVIAHFEPNTLKYIASPGLPKYFTRLEPLLVSILCIHQLPTLYIPTQLHHTLQRTHPPLPKRHNIPTLPEQHQPIPPLKYPNTTTYYTDGSLILGKAGYGVYQPHTNYKYSARLPGRQNVLLAELAAILHALTQAKESSQPNFILTDSLTALYLIRKYKHHPSALRNHPDKKLLQAIIQEAKLQKSHTTLQKVRAHIEIKGNEKVDILAKDGTDQPEITNAEEIYDAHNTPFWLFHSTEINPLRQPIRHLKAFLKEQNKNTSTIISNTATKNLLEWTNNPHIDHKLSNGFWTHPTTTDAQISQTLKFRHGQYVGNLRKTIIWPERFQNPLCTMCNLRELDTCHHLLGRCTHPIIHGIRITRHNKVVWKLHTLFLKHRHSRYYMLMNAGKNNNQPPDNTVPLWLLPCQCGTRRCTCPARLKPDLLMVVGLLPTSPPPTHPTQNLTIQLIEFTYCPDKNPDNAIANKKTKYIELEQALQNRGWKVNTTIIITAGHRGASHKSSRDILHTHLKIPKQSIAECMKDIHQHTLQYLVTSILNKRKIENNQTPTATPSLPNNLRL